MQSGRIRALEESEEKLKRDNELLQVAYSTLLASKSNFPICVEDVEHKMDM
jgi:hypothetical protein